jgi:NAD(P)-dependent dehydrogenase (short-subunit alcohol dehydrogenase family)
MNNLDNPLGIFAESLFKDRTVLVTGGGRGIGKQIALAFAGLGASTVIAGRNAENLDPTAEEIRAKGAKCLPVVTNIREPEEVDNLLASALKEFGHIDFLVNNAGGQFPARPGEISDRGWRAVIDLNLNGTWNVCSRVGPHMAEREFGAIINIVHVYALERGAPQFAHSGAARAGVVNLTKTLAYYYARQGVTVNALAPGFVSTEGLQQKEFDPLEHDDFRSMATEDVPAGRLAETDEVAAIVAFLCSPAARYINGITLVADGALSLSNWTPWMDPNTP